MHGTNVKIIIPLLVTLFYPFFSHDSAIE